MWPNGYTTTDLAWIAFTRQHHYTAILYLALSAASVSLIVKAIAG